MSQRRFVLLDRDGTVIAERCYLADPNELDLLPGAAAGLRRFQDLGVGLVIVTNQSGLGRGRFDQACLDVIHQRLQELLQLEGVTLDGLYYCPHVPADDCPCRKPRTGLVERASRELGFDPRRSFVIGDKPCDIDLGLNVGAQTVLVRTGYGAETEREGACAFHHVADDLVGAAALIENIFQQERGDRRSVPA